MKKIIVLIAVLFALTVFFNGIRAADPYQPVPGAYDGLTQEEIQDLEREREASRDIDREVSRSGNHVMVMEATAYTWTGYRTATGTWPAVGTIATDPEVIPLGTRLWVEGYGEAVALDTGGAIKGNIIDVYLPTESECWQWGRRMVEVRILEEE